MKHAVIMGTLLAFLSLAVIPDADAAGGRGRVTRQNSSGGITTVGGGAVQGPKGNKAFGARGYTTDGQGNVKGGSTQGFSTTSGAQGVRAGTFSRSSDGSFQRQGGATLQSSKGSMTTQGSMTKSADGTVSGSRSTSATNSAGYSYEGSTTYSSGSGVNHTGTCYDPEGNPIPCKK